MTDPVLLTQLKTVYSYDEGNTSLTLLDAVSEKGQ